MTLVASTSRRRLVASAGARSDRAATIGTAYRRPARLGGERPPCASTIAAAHREAEPDARPRARRRGRTSRTGALGRPAAGRGRDRATSISTTLAVATARADLDRRAPAIVLDRVLEQVDQHLLDQDRIDRQHGRSGLDVDLDRAVPRARPRSRGQRRADDLLDGNPLARAARTPVSTRVMLSRFVSDPLEPRGLVADRRRAARARRLGRESGRSSRSERRRAGDHRERRAQIVRDGDEQRAAHLLGARARARLARRSASRCARGRAPPGARSASSRRRCVGDSMRGVAVALQREHADRLARRRSGIASDARAGQRVGAAPRRLRGARAPSARPRLVARASGASPRRGDQPRRLVGIRTAAAAVECVLEVRERRPTATSPRSSSGGDARG